MYGARGDRSGAQWDLTLQLIRTGKDLEVHSFAAGEFCVAQPNEEFKIILGNRTSTGAAFELFVDGKQVGANKHVRANRIYTVPGWRVDDHTCRAFVFSPPPTFDASASASSHLKPAASSARTSSFDALGEVKAVVWPMMPRKTAPVRSQRGARPEHQQAAVPEDKKAVSLGVTTGAGSTARSVKKICTTKTDRSRGPLGTVKLRYCVPDALRLSPDPSLKAVGEALLANKMPGAASSSAAAAPSHRLAARQQPLAPPEGMRRAKREAPGPSNAGSGVENAIPVAKAAKRSVPEIIDLT